jgi:hypothetical protein
MKIYGVDISEERQVEEKFETFERHLQSLEKEQKRLKKALIIIGLSLCIAIVLGILQTFI